MGPSEKKQGDWLWWALGLVLGFYLAWGGIYARYSLSAWMLGLFLSAFAMGMGKSDRAWRWGIALVLGTFAAQIFYYMYVKGPGNLLGVEIIFLFVLSASPAFTGVYLGVLTKWIFTRLAKKKIPEIYFSTMAVVVLVLVVIASFYVPWQLSQRKYQISQRKYQKGVKVAKEELKAAEETFGPDHLKVVESLIKLARLGLGGVGGHSRATGRQELVEGMKKEVLPLQTRAMMILFKADEEAKGPDRSDLVKSMINLAMLYRMEGTALAPLRKDLWAQAESLYKRALAVQEKALGSDHPQVASHLQGLAHFYREQCTFPNDECQYANAKLEPLYKRVLAIQEKALGPEHPKVARSLNNLAVLYNAQGRDDEAKKLFARAKRIRAKQ